MEGLLSFGHVIVLNCSVFKHLFGSVQISILLMPTLAGKSLSLLCKFSLLISTFVEILGCLPSTYVDLCFKYVHNIERKHNFSKVAHFVKYTLGCKYDKVVKVYGP